MCMSEHCSELGVNDTAVFGLAEKPFYLFLTHIYRDMTERTAPDQAEWSFYVCKRMNVDLLHTSMYVSLSYIALELLICLFCWRLRCPWSSD